MTTGLAHTPNLRRFVLRRSEDASGVSGTGIVAEGCELTNGKVALSWYSQHTVVGVYDSMKSVEAIHGHGGKTAVEWLDAGGVR